MNLELYKKIINELSPPNSIAIAQGELTTLEEPTVIETESKTPAEAPELNKPITTNDIQKVLIIQELIRHREILKIRNRKIF